MPEDSARDGTHDQTMGAYRVSSGNISAALELRAFRLFGLIAAVCAALVLFTPGSTQADDLPSAASIRALSEAAYGPVPKNFVDVIDVIDTTGKSSGTVTSYHRDADSRIVNDFGDVGSQSGKYRGEEWRQDLNGHTVIVEPDPDLAKPETFSYQVLRVNTPVDAYAVSTFNAEGLVRVTYYDPKTWFIIRDEAVHARDRTVTTYSDFMTYGPRHLPQHWVTSAYTGETVSSTRRSYVVDGATEQDVAMPPSARTLVNYPPGIDTVSLPARFTPSGHVVIRVNIAGRGIDLFLDSGAGGITIDPSVASQLGLRASHIQRSNRAAGVTTNGYAVVKAMTIGPLSMNDVAINVVPFSADEDESTKAVGLLGFDFICESGITIDYVHHTVIAQRAGTYQPPTDRRTIALPVRLGTLQPMISVSINGAKAERTIVDTGAAGAFLIFDFFARRYPNALVDHGGIGSRSPEQRFFGVGGRFATKPYAIESVRLGQVNFRDFIVYRVMSSGSYVSNEDGLFGPKLLSLFDVHFDYPNGMMYLVPNANFDHSRA